MILTTESMVRSNNFGFIFIAIVLKILLSSKKRDTKACNSIVYMHIHCILRYTKDTPLYYSPSNVQLPKNVAV